MIIRTYVCERCNAMQEVELRADQWADPPPECGNCAGQTYQDFQQVNIGGSPQARATKMALDIAEKDYGVADIQVHRGDNGPPTVRYRDQGPGASSWGATNAALEQAVSLGKQTRLEHGSGLDVIKQMPDLIAASKRKSARVW